MKHLLLITTICCGLAATEKPWIHFTFDSTNERLNHLAIGYFDGLADWNITMMYYQMTVNQNDTIGFTMTNNQFSWSRTYSKVELNDLLLNYAIMDIDARTKIEENNPSVILVMKSKKIMYHTYENQAWMEYSCSNCQSENAPLPQVSAVWSEPHRAWISINSKGQLIKSENGFEWTDVFSIESILPDYQNIEEIFSISVGNDANTTGEVKWIFYMKDPVAKISYYFICSFEDSKMHLESEKIIFDYGEEFDELAVETGKKGQYGARVVTAIGSLRNYYYNSSSNSSDQNRSFKYLSSCVRLITLDNVNGKLSLTQKPAPYSYTFRNTMPEKLTNVSLKVSEQMVRLQKLEEIKRNVDTQTYFINASIQFSWDSKVEFEVLSHVFISYDAKIQTLIIRSASNKAGYEKSINAPLKLLAGNRIFFKLVVDRNVVEVFGNDRVAATTLVFSNEENAKMCRLSVENGNVTIESFEIYVIKPVPEKGNGTKI